MTIVSGFVYLLKCQTFYKVGFSQNINNRIESLQSGNPFDITLVDSFKSSNPYVDEQNIHKYLKAYRLHGEWFNIPSCVITNRKSWFKPTESLTNPKIVKNCEQYDRTIEYNKIERLLANNIPLIVEYHSSDNQLHRDVANFFMFRHSYVDSILKYAVEIEDHYYCFLMYKLHFNSDFVIPRFSFYSDIDFKRIKYLVKSGMAFRHALNIYISSHLDYLTDINYWVYLWCKKHDRLKDFAEMKFKVSNTIIYRLWGLNTGELATVLTCKDTEVLSVMDTESYNRYDLAEIAVKEYITYDKLDLFKALDTTPIRRYKKLPYRLDHELSSQNMSPAPLEKP